MVVLEVRLHLTEQRVLKMIALLIIIAFAGCICGLFWRVLSLVPTTVLAWGAAVYVAGLHALPLGQTVLFTIVCGIWLQISYIFSNILFYTDDRSSVLPLAGIRLWHHFAGSVTNKQQH